MIWSDNSTLNYIMLYNEKSKNEAGYVPYSINLRMIIFHHANTPM